MIAVGRGEEKQCLSNTVVEHERDLNYASNTHHKKRYNSDERHVNVGPSMR